MPGHSKARLIVFYVMPTLPLLLLQASKLLALYFIVAFGSSMDIAGECCQNHVHCQQLPPLPLKAPAASCCCAAIQADTSQDLAYDSELVTVGLSNLLTSVAGVGFSGSYIFSQTLFSLKMSVDTPLMGILLAGG
jgi:SulP family sulfate permease